MKNTYLTYKAWFTPMVFTVTSRPCLDGYVLGDVFWV